MKELDSNITMFSDQVIATVPRSILIKDVIASVLKKVSKASIIEWPVLFQETAFAYFKRFNESLENLENTIQYKNQVLIVPVEKAIE